MAYVKMCQAKMASLSYMRRSVLLLTILFVLLVFRRIGEIEIVNPTIVKSTVKEPLVKDEITTATTNVSKNNSGLETPKVVLFYSKHWGEKTWNGLENDYKFTHWNDKPCEVSNCRISYNREDLGISDAVMFHGRDIDFDISSLSRSVKNRTKQRWVFFIHESPINSPTNFRELGNVFNWTMTYRFDSDIFVPYSHYQPNTALGNHVQSSPRNYSEGKDRLVAWVVSHCGQQRDKVVRKLMEYIPVHVYGKCASQFNQSVTCKKGDNCLKNLSRYKFYLAFENSNCIGYITEKYWDTSLGEGLVPIVLGGGNYSDKNYAVPGSFINVLDFKSLKHLADYLLMLDGNDTAYNKYFAWKNQFYVSSVPWNCKLCAMLNNDSLPAKIYDYQRFQTFWGPEHNCRFVNEKVDKLASGT